jgi:hypothetical protein
MSGGCLALASPALGPRPHCSRLQLQPYASTGMLNASSRQYTAGVATPTPTAHSRASCRVPPLTWDNAIAQNAQNHASDCQFHHTENGQYGENLMSSWVSSAGNSPAGLQHTTLVPQRPSRHGAPLAQWDARCTLCGGEPSGVAIRPHPGLHVQGFDQGVICSLAINGWYEEERVSGAHQLLRWRHRAGAAPCALSRPSAHVACTAV